MTDPEAGPRRPPPPEGELETIIDRLFDVFNLKQALAGTGWTTRNIYERRDADPTFTRLWQLAWLANLERAEAELIDRALKGSERPIFKDDKQIGSYFIHSDRLAAQVFQRIHETAGKSNMVARARVELGPAQLALTRVNAKVKDFRSFIDIKAKHVSPIDIEEDWAEPGVDQAIAVKPAADESLQQGECADEPTDSRRSDRRPATHGSDLERHDAGGTSRGAPVVVARDDRTGDRAADRRSP